jgi:signal transduction histidine kinase/CheY-like chemotaxis protein/GAF domain-containing protein
VLAELAKVIPYDSAAVVLVQRDATRTMAARGFVDQAAVMAIAVPLGHLPASRQAIEQRRPVVIPDVQHLADFLKPSLADLAFARCVAVIPLVSYQEIVGLLYVISWKPGHYSTQDAEIAFRFAQQAAVAIANARFMDEARRRTEELAVRARQQQALLSIFPAISSELRLEKLLQRIVEEAVAVIPDAQRGSIIVRQADGFHFLGAVGYDLAMLQEIILPPEHLATYRSLSQHQVVSIRDLGEWESHYLSQHVKDIFRAQGAEIKMTLSATIVVEGQVFGYLNLDNLETYDAFGPLSRDMAGLFAAQAAVAVANARLHGELEERVRRRTEEIRRQRDRTAAILQSVADGVVVTDLDGKIISTNPVAEAWLYHIEVEGRAENQSLIAFVRRLVTQIEDDPPDIIEFPAWEQKLKSPCWQLTNCTHEDCPAHGQEEILCWQTPGAYCLIAQEWSLERPPVLQTPACPVRARLQLVSLQAQVAGLREGETVQGAVIVLRDISRQRTLDRLKSQFVSTVSHELRTPLTNIKLYHGLLKRGREEKHQYYMEVMEREIVRLERLIQDILDLSRLEMQDRPPRREIVDVNALLQEKIDIYTLQAESKGLKLHLATTPNALQVHADPNQLRQVFTNLLTNAINYTPEGGEVWLSSGTWHLDGKGWWKTGPLSHTDPAAPRPPEGHWVVVNVRDSGVGIAAEDMPRIFDRFYRGAQVGLETSGSGLGLSIVREILDLHGGHCLVESTPGSGSAFTVLLPLPEPKREVSVLVADDEEHIGRLIRRFLSREGMQIRWVANGQQTLEAIAAERPDLLILDLGMPVLDGYRVLERLREQGDTPSLPVLVLSSWAEDKFQRVRRLGATEFLNKPFSGTVLVDVVKRLIGRAAPPGD